MNIGGLGEAVARQNHRSLYKDLHINPTTVFMPVNGHTRMFSPEIKGSGTGFLCNKQLLANNFQSGDNNRPAKQEQ